MTDLTERETHVIAWREADPPLSYRHIAQRIGVGAGRARQIYLEAKQKAKLLSDPTYEFKGLSHKEYDILYYQNIRTRDEALQAFKDGRLRPLKYGRWETTGVRGLGKKTYLRLAQWAGYDMAPQPPKKEKRCPHCGGLL